MRTWQDENDNQYHDNNDMPENPLIKNEYRCFLLFLISNAKMAHIVFVMQIHGNDSNLLIVFYVQIMPDDFVMQLHR
ncbi:hypothetical protein RNO26_24495, partial [Escherichia coli]|nr:hypothetical protein [Escherichia coli]